MTTYGKIEEGQLITAPYNKVENLISQGYLPFDEGLVSQCLTGIITTDELIQKQANLEKSVVIKSQIDELEKSQLRAIREIALNIDLEFAMGKLQSLNEQIADLRSQMVGL